MSNRGAQRDNTSGYKGVVRQKDCNRWRAQIKVNGKCKHLGLFVNIKDAARAYDEAAEKYFGEFAHKNF